jgi:transposase InsO family protein
LHTEIPDTIQPYKHYDSDTIQCTLDGGEDALNCEASDSTMRRWKEDFEAAKADIEQRLASIYAQESDSTTPLITSASPISIIRATQLRWLGFVMRLLINAGHKIRTRFAFCPSQPSVIWAQRIKTHMEVKEMTKPLQEADAVATQRFNLIAPLLDEGLDKGRRADMALEIAGRSGVSERTLRRYASAWKQGGFDALKPIRGWQRPDCALGSDFGDILEAAIQLRRESPSRSVADIIKILELEGTVLPGTLARSTLQRHLAARGYASSQMRMYASKGAAARRFQKEHRCQLFQSDIKFGPMVDEGNGCKRQIYLFVWIDDATRYIVSARFYMDQTVDSLEDCLRRAIQGVGVPEKIFVDNGSQYRSKWLSRACAILGVRLLKSRPYHPEGKGKVERFNRTVEKFISEAALMRLNSLDQYNEHLGAWIDEYYHKQPHAGIGGVSPGAAFASDQRPLRFVAADALREAFLHAESRKVDKTGCVSFQGNLYEVGLAYIGSSVEVRYDPSWTQEVEIVHGHGQPFLAQKLSIGANSGTMRELPEHMRDPNPPETSRMLRALKKRHDCIRKPSGIATSFKGFWEGGASDV